MFGKLTGQPIDEAKLNAADGVVLGSMPDFEDSLVVWTPSKLSPNGKQMLDIQIPQAKAKAFVDYLKGLHGSENVEVVKRDYFIQTYVSN